MSCTTLLVGKDASYDGSTLIARTHDSCSGEYNPHKFVVVTADEQPRKYKSVISHVEIDLPDDPMQYTSLPRAVSGAGIWGGCGVNEVNVAMSATETITSNPRVLGADPLVELIPAKGEKGSPDYVPEQVGGIGEEDIFTIVLPYIQSARAGVIRLGSILEAHGTYEMNAVAFQDADEIWWLESIGGHHWIAKRVPDDCYVTMPNQLGIDTFDLYDALGAQLDNMCSADLKEFIKDNYLDLSLEGAIIDKDGDEINPGIINRNITSLMLNTRYAFGSNEDSDHTYNTCRSWIIQRFFNPKTSKWDGVDADYRPDSSDIPWCRKAERKITVEDVKYVLSNHYQGTEYDPYGKHGDDSKRGMFRPIGINRTNHLSLVQIRPYMPKEIQCLQWITFGSDVFNALVPFYANINRTPEYLANTTGEVTTDNFYWANRLIAALADAHYGQCSSHIERYQLRVQSKGHEFINHFDAKFKADNPVSMEKFCEIANAAIEEFIKAETTDVLDKVLFEASNGMKNGFSRSDA